MLRDHGERFLARVFTPAEREYCMASRTPAIRLAGRFAAKEAIFKALGTGWRGGLAWTDMEILPDGYGKPLVSLGGGCAEEAARIGVTRMLISISHTATHAVASAIGVRDPA
jgi:holo-[acyl-carrier protein] synthase